ncbi:MAG: hypothetical protein LBV52_01360 [Spirochaetaceae bacterium]|nr:hypothetical protein [Spirochaetaceae bacterium]
MNGKKYFNLGIDVGSTTVKIVVFEPDTQKMQCSIYVRHNSYQAETVHKILQEVSVKYPDAVFRAAVCGSGGKPIADALKVPYIQEVVANSIAVKTFYPSARVAIELGGQDAKIVFFHNDSSGNLSASDMRMNGSCAGGTGAFIDEVATLLKVPVEEFGEMAKKGTFIYDISGRCGVFAKTDIQPLLNQGGLREDIALSTFHAIAKQTIGGLAQGLEITPPVIFEGGPLTFNPKLIDVFAERLHLGPDDIIRPENPETLVAFGAALSVDGMFKDFDYSGWDISVALSDLNNFHEELGKIKTEGKPFFESDAEKSAFFSRHAAGNLPVMPVKTGETLQVYIGLDVGSTTSKFVLIDQDENIVDSFYSNNRGEPLQVIKAALNALKQKYDAAGVKLEIIALGTTGYGELLFDKALGADYHTV